MTERRKFLKIILGFLSLMGLRFNPFFSLIHRAYAEAKRIILPKGTKAGSLASKNPRDLDTRNLEITPINEFGTMGTTDYKVDLEKWRLHITGRVKQPLELTYADIKALPSISRKVLLICPGVFSLYGDWKGISIKPLLLKARIEKGATHAIISGPEGPYEKVETFPIDEVLKDQVFLAYAVNGETLPRKHGFPLRVVAEDYYGDDWVKYAYKVSVRGPE